MALKFYIYTKKDHLLSTLKTKLYNENNYLQNKKNNINYYVRPKKRLDLTFKTIEKLCVIIIKHEFHSTLIITAEIDNVE